MSLKGVSTVSLTWLCLWGGLWGYLLPNISLLLFSWRSGLGTLVQAVLQGTGHQGGLCTKLSSCPQLRASKDDCQREKEEKEKLKKMLKQHKQVGRGKNPS